MKYTLLSTILLLAILSIAAVVTPKKKDRIKQIKNLNTSGVAEYTYTADGKVLSIKNPTGSMSIFKYGDKVIYRQTDDPRTHTSPIDTYYLDSKGLAKELRMGAHTSTINGGTQQFEYDKDGFQIGWKMLNNGEVVNVFKSNYKDSNEVSMSQSFPGDVRKGTGYASYYVGTLNTIGNENMGQGFLGISSKNLVKDKIYMWSTDRDTSRTNYNYHFDDKGRVSIKVTYYKGKMGDSTAYSYY